MFNSYEDDGRVAESANINNRGSAGITDRAVLLIEFEKKLDPAKQRVRRNLVGKSREGEWGLPVTVFRFLLAMIAWKRLKPRGSRKSAKESSFSAGRSEIAATLERSRASMCTDYELGDVIPGW